MQSSAQYFNIATHKLGKIQFWKKLFVIRFPYKHCCRFWPLELPIKVAPEMFNIRPIILPAFFFLWKLPSLFRGWFKHCCRFWPLELPIKVAPEMFNIRPIILPAFFFPLETTIFVQRLVQIPDELCVKYQMRYLTIQSYRMLFGRWRIGAFSYVLMFWNWTSPGDKSFNKHYFI